MLTASWNKQVSQHSYRHFLVTHALKLCSARVSHPHASLRCTEWKSWPRYICMPDTVCSSAAVSLAAKQLLIIAAVPRLLCSRPCLGPKQVSVWTTLDANSRTGFEIEWSASRSPLSPLYRRGEFQPGRSQESDQNSVTLPSRRILHARSSVLLQQALITDSYYRRVP